MPPLLALMVLVAAPSAAHAGCGGVVTAKAGKKLGPYANPLIIGDSVLLGAVAPVARIGYTVNTQGCRSWTQGARKRSSDRLSWTAVASSPSRRVEMTERE